MHRFSKSSLILYVIIACGGISCTVTNALYVNDPMYTDKKEFAGYVGGGSGIRADIESVDSDGNITFSDELTMAPNFYIGGQYGALDKLDLRFSIHMPFLIGGFGLRGGVEYSFLSNDSPFNIAVGGDFGGVFAKDSIRILGDSQPLDIEVNGAINADFFVPITFSFSEDVRLILTPRYSLHTFFIRENINASKTFKFKPATPGVSLGLRLKRVYLEASAFEFNGSYFPNFGLTYTIKDFGKQAPTEYEDH